MYLQGVSVSPEATTKDGNYFLNSSPPSATENAMSNAAAAAAAVEDDSFFDLPKSKASNTKYPPGCNVLVVQSNDASSSTTVDDEHCHTRVTYGSVTRAGVDSRNSEDSQVNLFQVEPHMKDATQQVLLVVGRRGLAVRSLHSCLAFWYFSTGILVKPQESSSLALGAPFGNRQSIVHRQGTLWREESPLKGGWAVPQLL